MIDQDMPEGFTHTPSTSAFPNHMAAIHDKRTTGADGREICSYAVRVEPHHVNTWGFAHAALIAGLADVATSGCAYEVGGPPVIVAQMTTQFIGAPKLGDLLLIDGWVTKRTRSLVFTECRGEVDGKVMFTATAVQKIIGA